MGLGACRKAGDVPVKGHHGRLELLRGFSNRHRLAGLDGALQGEVIRLHC